MGLYSDLDTREAPQGKPAFSINLQTLMATIVLGQLLDCWSGLNARAWPVLVVTWKKVLMLELLWRLLPEIPLFIVIAIATHLVMSFGQTLMHYRLGHRPIGGKLFSNHINFHHTYYSKNHLVSQTYLGEEGNITPFFLIPIGLVGAITYFILPIDLFIVQMVACAASYYAHVFFDREFHVAGSRLLRFAWFRRKQEQHFVHHRHANCNFAVIHFFWDRVLGTYRSPDPG